MLWARSCAAARTGSLLRVSQCPMFSPAHFELATASAQYDFRLLTNFCQYDWTLNTVSSIVSLTMFLKSIHLSFRYRVPSSHATFNPAMAILPASAKSPAASASEIPSHVSLAVFSKFPSQLLSDCTMLRPAVVDVANHAVSPTSPATTRPTGEIRNPNAEI